MPSPINLPAIRCFSLLMIAYFETLLAASTGEKPYSAAFPGQTIRHVLRK
jgi:hypothetical protein